MHGSPQDDLPDLAAQIRRLRRERGLTQDEVATYVGVSQATWSRVERKGALSVLQLLRLQELLGVETLESFFGVLPSRQTPRSGGSPGPIIKVDD